MTTVAKTSAFMLALMAGMAVAGEPYVVKEGDGWVRFANCGDVLPGSALDFSEQGLQDAPAGKHGWLRAKGGHFEFEGRPGVEQRFYGANLCYSANYLDHALADRVVDRFVRCGYNSVRIHHHDGTWAEGRKADVDSLDYLVAKCIERGIYVTTDLYVSRPVKWREIGISRDGTMDMQLFKTYIGVYRPAFSNWCAFAKAFLSHVNPYTGRSYANEPGMPLVSLVNEGRLCMGWELKKSDENVVAAWREFGGVGDVPKPWSKATNAAHMEFDEWINAKIWTNCRAYVRSLGAKALLTNDNNGLRHGEGEGLVPLYDYVDNHFYVEHPKFLGAKWKLPSRCENKNPICEGQPQVLHSGWAKGSAKPYTITEWNFPGPCRYRGMGGILTGALAAEQEWDGLWRFAYSHYRRDIEDGANTPPGYFDCVADPVLSASERAAVCLFLRRDADLGGSRIDKDRGTMSVVTPRTCGGFAEAGKIAAGPLTFSVCTDAAAGHAVPTTLWLSSIDGKPISGSSRMLLSHITDAQGEGTTFEDGTGSVLLKRGIGCLVRDCAAEVAIRVRNPRRYRVWALAANGARRFAVPCRAEGGVLRFSAAARGADGMGVVNYEVSALGRGAAK